MDFYTPERERELCFAEAAITDPDDAQNGLLILADLCMRVGGLRAILDDDHQPFAVCVELDVYEKGDLDTITPRGLAIRLEHARDLSSRLVELLNEIDNRTT